MTWAFSLTLLRINKPERTNPKPPSPMRALNMNDPFDILSGLDAMMVCSDQSLIWNFYDLDQRWLLVIVAWLRRFDCKIQHFDCHWPRGALVLEGHPWSSYCRLDLISFSKPNQTVTQGNFCFNSTFCNSLLIRNSLGPCFLHEISFWSEKLKDRFLRLEIPSSSARQC